MSSTPIGLRRFRAPTDAERVRALRKHGHDARLTPRGRIVLRWNGRWCRVVGGDYRHPSLMEFSVGAPANDAPPATSANAPPGFAQIFKGWNVWDVWQSQDPDTSIVDDVANLGVPLERQLRIWVEDWIKDHAPAAAVADPWNPAALRGAQVEIIPSAGGLELLQSRADVPGVAGAVQVGKEGSQAKKFTVRFFNRGDETATTWPHDKNYLLDGVYQPSASNPITSGAPPSSLAGAASGAADAAGSALKVVGVIAGVGVAALLVVALINASKGARGAA